MIAAGSRLEAALAAMLWGVLSVVAWVRLDATTRGTVWAEDGLVFLAERERLGPWESLFHVYAGYLHFAPRVLADIARWVAPIEFYAVTITAMCCVVVGAVGALVFLCTRDLIDSVPIRAALGATTVLVPAGSIETMGNLANLHWYFLWLAPWLLLARPTRWRYAVALGVVALVAGLTEIQVALFLPLVLLRFRDRMIWPAAAGLSVGVGAQILASVSHPRPRPDEAVPGLVDQIKGYLLNVVLPIWNPSIDGPGGLFVDHGWRGALLMFVPFVLAGTGLLISAAVVVRRRPLDTRAMAIVAIAMGSTGPFVAAMVLNPSPRLAYDSFTVVELAERMPLRYGVVPAMFLIAGILLWADMVDQRGHRLRGLTAAAIVSSVVALQLWHSAPDGTRRSDGPGWRAAVTEAQQACPDMAPPSVGAAPTKDWAMSLSCEALLDE